MIRANGLYGRAVVDLDTAERVGEIDEIIIDPYGPGIAGYVVACERSLWSARKRSIIPADAVHAIGPDAITIRSINGSNFPTTHLDPLPRLSELTGRRMMSFGGHLLGSIEDALIDERDGRIIGYPLERPGGTWLESVFGLNWRVDRPDYVRADAALRIGARIIVVPDDAVMSGDSLSDAAVSEQPTPESLALSSAASVPTVDTSEWWGVPDSLPDSSTEAQSTTTPFAVDGRLQDRLDITDEGLGLEPASQRDDHDRTHGVESEHDRLSDRPQIDSEEDTGLIAVSEGTVVPERSASPTGTGRGRTRRRSQAEKVR